MTFNRDLLATRPHPSKQISDAVAGNPEVVDLTVGEPGYGPPAVLLDTVAARIAERVEEPSAAYNRYAQSRGVPALRRAVAEYYRRRYGLAVDPDTRVLITHGGAGAIWLTVFTLTNAGDEVLIPDPCYMLFEPIATSLGRRPVRIATSPERGFRLDPAEVARRVTDRTRLLMLNSPENPTGAVYDRGTLAELLALAGERGFHLMHDEVFDSILFSGTHVPALALAPDGERVVMVNSFSKRFGMTGWRLGWLVGSPEMVAHAAKAHTLASLATGTLIQEAAAAALSDPASEGEVAAHCRALRDKTLRFVDGLLALDGFALPYGPPAGGFYVFADVRRLFARLPAEERSGGSAGEEVARYLLRHAKVAVVPGSGFGQAGEGHVRISVAAPEARLTEALARFRGALEGLGDGR